MNRWVRWAVLSAAIVSVGCDGKEPAGGEGGTGGMGGMSTADMSPTPDMAGGTGGTPMGEDAGIDAAGGGGGEDAGGPQPQLIPFGGECTPGDVCGDPVAEAEANPEGPSENELRDIWRECVNARCVTNDCSSAGLGTGLSYCTRDCEADSFCDGAVDGPYGDAFKCLTDGTSGTCAPGSNARCDGAGNGMCEGDEECKFQLVWAADATYGATCQPPHEGGRAIGETCNEDDAGMHCLNDNCLAGRCRAFCDKEADMTLCNPDSEECVSLPLSADGSVSIDICFPGPCETNAECGDDEMCSIGLDGRFLVGTCRAASEEQTARLGDRCDDDVGEAGDCPGICFGSGTDSSYCSARCQVDADCGDGGFCGLVNFRIDEAGNTAPAMMCQPGTGSGRMCVADGDCEAEGDIADEACEYVIRQDLDNGRPQGEAVVGGRCAAVPNGAVEPGEACGEAMPCRTESLCLTFGGQNVCGSVCQNSGDCRDNSVCLPLQFTDTTYVGACIPREGSLMSCDRNVDCGEGEHCAVNLLPNSGIVEKLCLSNRGAGGPGAECDQDSACATGRCRARTTRIGTGYCEGTCFDATDCAEDYACEEHLLFDATPEEAGDELHGNFCVPAAVCSLCAFDGTLPCGTGNACSTVRFSEDRAGPACLATCAGLEDDSCGEGFTCGPRRNGADAIEGEFVCGPDDADVSCLDARPRR